MRLLDMVDGVGIYGIGLNDLPVIQFCCGMEIDADGSPHAYHPEPGAGLDFLANAGKPGNWYSLATDPSGQPYVQSGTDPAPGYFVSTTALQYPQYPVSDPRRYVDSETVPFIVLPSHLPFRVPLGAKCQVINLANGLTAEAIYADVGPAGKIGEGSIALAKALGIPSDPKHGGIAKGILYIVYLTPPVTP